MLENEVAQRSVMARIKTRDELAARLARSDADLRRLSVVALSVFGSFARETANDNSDVDLLVDFDGKATFDRYMDAKFFLEGLFGRRVDLVTRKALRPELKERIEREAIRVV